MEKRLFLTFNNNMKIRHEALIRGLLLWILSGFRATKTFPTREEELLSSSLMTNITTNSNIEPLQEEEEEDRLNTYLLGNQSGGNGSEDSSGEWINGEEEEMEGDYSPQTTTTLPFDVNSGNLKLKVTLCEELKDCRNIDGSYCNKKLGLCACRADHPISDSLDCFRESKIGEFCHYDVQCVRKDSQSRCDSTLHICQCQPRFVVKGSSSKRGWCVENEADLNMKIGSHMDPALFGIMGGLALMFIIICVVLQLFARAQFRENRTIFNTPNPRLMNVSLMKDRRSHMNNSNSMDSNNGASQSLVRTKASHEPIKNSPETARVTVESSA